MKTKHNHTHRNVTINSSFRFLNLGTPLLGIARLFRGDLGTPLLGIAWLLRGGLGLFELVRIYCGDLGLIFKQTLVGFTCTLYPSITKNNQTEAC